MFFIISKILSFILTPIIWVISLLVFAFFTKKPERRKKLILYSIITIFIFGNTFIIDEVMRAWEMPATKYHELEENYDIGIVLGGGMITYDAQLKRNIYNNNPDRIMQAFDLYKKKKIKRIMVVGGSGTLIHRNVKESILLKEFLLDIGIPENDIIIETESDNTYQNAKNAKPILDSIYKEGKYLLITSGYHMRRSQACFEKQEIKTTAYSTNQKHGIRRFNLKHILIPNISNFSTWYLFLHEIIGYTTYWVVDYL